MQNVVFKKSPASQSEAVIESSLGFVIPPRPARFPPQHLQTCLPTVRLAASRLGATRDIEDNYEQELSKKITQFLGLRLVRVLSLVNQGSSVRSTLRRTLYERIVCGADRVRSNRVSSENPVSDLLHCAPAGAIAFNSSGHLKAECGLDSSLNYADTRGRSTWRLLRYADTESLNCLTATGVHQ
jgi:hypothetical protein